MKRGSRTDGVGKIDVTRRRRNQMTLVQNVSVITLLPWQGQSGGATSATVVPLEYLKDSANGQKGQLLRIGCQWGCA